MHASSVFSPDAIQRIRGVEVQGTKEKVDKFKVPQGSTISKLFMVDKKLKRPKILLQVY